MNKLMTINDKQLSIKEFKEQRVVTFKDIDMLHQRPDGTAKRNFNENKKRFMQGLDFFFVKPSDIRTYEIRTSEINNSGTYLITISGYLMLVKSFNDDLAWEVQRQLVNNYFNLKIGPSGKADILKEVTNAIKLISNPNIRDRAMAVALEEILGVDLSQEREPVETQNVIDPLINKFIEECLVIDPKGKIKNKRLVEMYNAWSKSNLTYTKFAINTHPVVIKLGLKKIRRNYGLLWIGIKEK